MSVDPTAIDIKFDPTIQRMSGVARHGYTPFDVPFISELAPGFWQGGTQRGLKLPTFIEHLVSAYPWEKYTVHAGLKTERYFEMLDAEDQDLSELDEIAGVINECRADGPTVALCQAGLNRSSLIAARALFLNHDYETGDEIVDVIRAKRSPACLCNPAFERAVRSWRR